MCDFTRLLSGAIHTLEQTSVGESLTELQYLCLYMACLETGDVGGHFADIMKVNLAQPIAVKYPQLESQVIMTDRLERERV